MISYLYIVYVILDIEHSDWTWCQNVYLPYYPLGRMTSLLEPTVIGELILPNAIYHHHTTSFSPDNKYASGIVAFRRNDTPVYFLRWERRWNDQYTRAGLIATWGTPTNTTGRVGNERRQTARTRPQIWWCEWFWLEIGLYSSITLDLAQLSWKSLLSSMAKRN